MRAEVELWLRRLAPAPGVLALGVQLPDKSCCSRSWSEAFPENALDRVWRSLADLFPVLKLHHLPSARLRWFYERAVLYCERREDGLWLGLFTAREPQAVDFPALARLLEEFRALGKAAV